MRLTFCASLLVTSIFALTACEPELPGPGAASFPSSSRIAISPDGDRVFVALPDHDLVRAVDATTGELLAEQVVDGTPHRLTALSDGRVAVSARATSNVVVLDSALNELARIEVGAEPYGLIETDAHLVVALMGQAELARIPLDDADHVEDRVALEHTHPRGLALGPDGALFVSHFKAGVLSEVDLDAAVPRGTVDLSLPANPFFVANQVEHLTVSPDGAEIVIPHEECNNDPAQFGAGGTDLTGQGAAQYYVEGPTGFPAVVPSVTRVDTTARVNLSEGPGELEPLETHVQDRAGLAPAIISPLDRETLGENLVNRPVATALIDDGRFEMVVNYGSGNVIIRRTVLREGERSVVAAYDVGVGASSIVVSPDGELAYVWNELDHTLYTLDVPYMPYAERGQGSLSLGRNIVDGWDERRVLELAPKRSTQVAREALPADVALGRKLFNGVSEDVTRSGAITCASCHPDGMDDGITWNFAEGPRQTPALWGGILDTAPFHWDQLVTDVDRLNEITIQGRMGGQGLAPSELQAIGAFMDTLPVPNRPMSANNASVTRGAAIFARDDVGCLECHGGAHYTDNRAHDVGTGIGFIPRETIVEVATPLLHGLAFTGPYLHDGSAETLRDVVDRLVVTDRMGTGSHLSEQEIVDLVAFLETL